MKTALHYIYITILMSFPAFLNAGITTEEFKEKSAAFLQPQEANALAEQIFKEKQIALIVIGYELDNLKTNIVLQIRKERDVQFKRIVVLTLLEKPWPTDPEERVRQVGSQPPAILYYCSVEVMKHLLPNERLDVNDPKTWDKFSTLESRRRLAALFSEALKSENEK